MSHQPSQQAPSTQKPQPKRREHEPVVLPPPRPQSTSQADMERSDWEGMGQSRYQPDSIRPPVPAEPGKTNDN